MTVVLEPALRKLLDELPVGDPDAREPVRVELWTAWTAERHVVVANTKTRIVFGPWAGPPMRMNEIVLHGRRLDSGHEARWPLDADDTEIRPGNRFAVNVTVVVND